MSESDKGSTTQPKKPKHRSPNYPRISIGKAIDLVSKQHQIDGLQKIPANIAHSRWGYAPFTARAHLREAALKAYGLIEVLGLGKSRQIRVSERADQLIRSHPEKEKIIKEAALLPSLHRELWEHYEAKLPQDDVLRQFLIWKKGFNDKSVSRFISQIRTTISFANLTEVDILETKDGDDSENDISRVEDKIPSLPLPKQPGKVKMTQLSENVDFRELRFLLPSGEAVLFVPKQMNDSDFTTLELYMSAFKSASESETQTEEDEPEQTG